MSILKSVFFLLIFAFISIQVAAQDNKQKAIELCKSAVKFEDRNQYDQVLSLLTQAQNLDPTNVNIAYEIAYYYYVIKTTQMHYPLHKKHYRMDMQTKGVMNS